MIHIQTPIFRLTSHGHTNRRIVYDQFPLDCKTV